MEQVRSLLMFGIPLPSHMPCAACGASVPRWEEHTHECDGERRVEYELFQLRAELDGLTDELHAYLASPAGEFEAWCATRERPPLQES